MSRKSVIATGLSLLASAAFARPVVAPNEASLQRWSLSPENVIYYSVPSQYASATYKSRISEAFRQWSVMFMNGRHGNSAKHYYVNFKEAPSPELAQIAIRYLASGTQGAGCAIDGTTRFCDLQVTPTGTLNQLRFLIGRAMGVPAVVGTGNVMDPASGSINYFTDADYNAFATTYATADGLPLERTVEPLFEGEYYGVTPTTFETGIGWATMSARVIAGPSYLKNLRTLAAVPNASALNYGSLTYLPGIPLIQYWYGSSSTKYAIWPHNAPISWSSQEVDHYGFVPGNDPGRTSPYDQAVLGEFYGILGENRSSLNTNYTRDLDPQGNARYFSFPFNPSELTVTQGYAGEGVSPPLASGEFVAPLIFFIDQGYRAATKSLGRSATQQGNFKQGGWVFSVD